MKLITISEEDFKAMYVSMMVMSMLSGTGKVSKDDIDQTVEYLSNLDNHKKCVAALGINVISIHDTEEEETNAVS